MQAKELSIPPVNAMNNATICRICSSPKAKHHFVCPLCWKSLPQELRTPFVVQKLRCLAWLREHHERMERIEAEYLTPPEDGSW